MDQAQQQAEYKQQEREWKDKIRGAQYDLPDDVKIFTESREVRIKLKQGETLGAFARKNFGALFKGYIKPQYKQAFFWAVDNISRWQYSMSYYRRSYRSSDETVYSQLLNDIICKFSELGFFESPLEALITGNVSGLEAYRLSNSTPYYSPAAYEYLLAYELDNDNESVLEAVKTAVYGEGTAFTRDLIRGIMRSKNARAHKALGDLLLAARLQEGLRQSICENADCGSPEGFRYIADIIAKNDLLRFSSVKRSVMTWCGLYDIPDDLDRLSKKIFALMIECLDSEQARERYLSGEDTVEIYISLWSYAFYDTLTAMQKVKELVRNGSHHQRLTAGVFAGSLDNIFFENECGKFALKNFYKELDTAAVFTNLFAPDASSRICSIAGKLSPYDGIETSKIKEHGYADMSGLFTQEEAREFYGILKELKNQIPKKELVFSPCVFPWKCAVLSKSKITEHMVFLASGLRDNALIDEMCECLADLTSNRDNALTLLTQYPNTPVQRKTAVAAVADRDSFTANRAFKIVTHTVKLEKDNFRQLEAMLKYKSANTRKNAITLLMKQDDEGLFESCCLLLSDKTSEKRTAGLDIALQIKNDETKAALFERLIPQIEQMKRGISKEDILIEQLLENSPQKPQEGFGLYTEADEPLPPIDKAYVEECRKLFGEVFPYGVYGKKLGLIKKRDYMKILKKLDDFIEQNKDREYVGYDGEAALLGNYQGAWVSITIGKRIILPELWLKFYEEEIKDPAVLFAMMIKLRASDDNSEIFKRGNAVADKLFGAGFSEPAALRYTNIVRAAVNSLAMTEDKNADISEHIGRLPKEFVEKMGTAVLSYLLDLPDDTLVMKAKKDHDTDSTYTSYASGTLHCNICHPQILGAINAIDTKSYDSAKTNFPLRYALFERIDKFENALDRYGPNHIYRRYLPEINVYDMIRAAAFGVISDNALYKWIFTRKRERKRSYYYYAKTEFDRVLNNITDCIILVREKNDEKTSRSSSRYAVYTASRSLLGKEPDEVYTDDDKKILQKTEEIYDGLINVILDIELKRGDTETVFSQNIHSIERIYGAETFVRILAALGKETFERSTYSSGSTKKGTLSHLALVCVPSPEDNADKLRELVSKTDISEERLIEAAMYSPEWLDIVGEYLGWEGFVSGCYYFIAHMNESFDNKREAMIAKFTPLTPEELNAGAFDINWFKEAYAALGEERFSKLYNAAKYISDGSKHSRARKYADAAMGRLNKEQTQAAIKDKRNKDLLMAYSLIPVSGEDDIMERYLFVQEFVKQSKKFGAQRRASEAAAADIALKNLASAAGCADVTRLKLRMEAKLFENIKDQFEPREIEDVTVWLEVTDGKAELKCQKGGKVLKSVPAKLKKNEYIIALNETKKQLVEQYRRTRAMLEQAMEDREEFTLGEINMLKADPVAKALLDDLVFAVKGKCLLIKDGRLCDINGNAVAADESEKLLIAHPIDMHREGTWRDYQQYLFDNRLVQPFRQVFRELYLKTDEELECSQTRRYAGNQIQVKQTIAVMRTRRWVCDIEDGLQKVFFGENLVAKLYALADWFSPSDVECPTLEWVSFSDRKTGKPVKIKDVPDIIFSEVMRDADLAVSAAHAGGVDPEHSHSTIEMRAAILSFTLPLFKLSNCEISGSHVFIKGSRAEYSVHLGSGVCHIRGGAALNILPVHSQSRGRIFLPFADDDPKTAEVISKVLMLAEDRKIKDPSILSQIG